MKPYSIDLREKIVKTYEQGGTSIRKVADRFGVAKSFVQKLLSMKKTRFSCRTETTGWSHEGRVGWIWNSTRYNG
jgi:transposase